MDNFRIIIFILAILIGLSAVIDKLKIPYPVLLVLVGLTIGFIPGLPNLPLDPDVIFFIFLPPLLYDAASRTSWHDFKANLRPISALGISLVFFTTVVVAITAHYFIPEFGWPVAFLLGAIVSPPDAMASAGIIKGLGLNRRVITILEGESLVNDASALMAYRYALMASITGGFIFRIAGLQFFLQAGAGILIGLCVGYVLVFVHKRINNFPVVETSLTLLTPFLSYLTAEQLHTSGVLAVVCTGMFISWRSQEIFSFQTRMQTRVVWNTLIFLLNGFIFILIGLQLPAILKQLTIYKPSALIFYGLIISLATVLIRFLWVFASARFFAMFKEKKNTKQERSETWKSVLIVAWTGTRGVISLAAALALPLTLYNGEIFPQRNLILFLCFSVIFVTLVVQGFSLPLLIRLLDVKPSAKEDKEEKELQLYMVNNTLHFINYEYAGKLAETTRKELKAKYTLMALQLGKEINTHSRNEEEGEQTPVRVLTDKQQVQIDIGRFQRSLLLQLHKDAMFSDDAIRRVERGMDIDDLKFDQLLPKKDK